MKGKSGKRKGKGLGNRREEGRGKSREEGGGEECWRGRNIQEKKRGGKKVEEFRKTEGKKKEAD